MLVPSRSLRRALAGGVLLAGALPASALAAPQVELRPAAGPPGSELTLRGTGFAAAKGVSVGAANRRTTRVRTSARGRFTLKLRAPRRGKALDLVTRAGSRRVRNHFAVSRSAVASVEVATTRGRRLRVSPLTVLPGGQLQLRGSGLKAGSRVRLTGFGTAGTATVSRKGTFKASLLVPVTLTGSSSRLTLAAGSLRLRVRLTIAAPAAPPSVTAPAATAAAATPLVPPSNTRAPRVAGVPTVGRDISADPGGWEGSAPIAFAYEWRRCTTTRCTAIAGATGQTYRVTGSDGGRRLQVAVTASNALGSAQAVSAQSDDVATLPSATTAPSISGTPRVGASITGNPGSWSGTPKPTLATQWKRCPASGACATVGTAAKYPVTTADVGSTLVFEVTATNAGGSVTASARTGKVAPPPPEGGTLVAQWSMDETSGSTAFDSSGGGHHGAIRNVGIGAAGILGGAFDFGGVARRGDVRIANGGLGSPGARNVTISMYVKLGQNPPTDVEDWDLLKLGTYSVGEYKVEIYPNGRAFCGFAGNAASGGVLVQQPVTGSGASRGPKGPRVTDGIWHKITCKKTASAVTLLVDDAVVETVGKAAGSISNSADDLVLGAHANGTEYYDGLMDEVSIRFG